MYIGVAEHAGTGEGRSARFVAWSDSHRCISGGSYSSEGSSQTMLVGITQRSVRGAPVDVISYLVMSDSNESCDHCALVELLRMHAYTAAFFGESV